MSKSKSVHILNGVDALININNIKPGMSTFDLKKLEKTMIDGGMIQHRVKDPQDKLNDELREAAKKLGINFGEPKKETLVTSNLNSNLNTQPVSNFSNTNVTNSVYKPPVSSSVTTPTTYAASDSDEGSDEPSEQDEEADDDAADEESDDEPTHDSSQSVHSAYSSYGQQPSYSQPSQPSYSNDDLRSRTQEQQRRSHIDHVVGSNSTGGFSFENEKREDLKCAMLSEIDILWGSLVEADVDLSRIPPVDRKSSYEDVESVLKMLRHKNDHANYVSLAEELMLGGSHLLESAFDGDRTYFGKYRPNLTGYSNVLLTKFRRFRVENSQIVSGIMHDYNIGPGMRILMELVPSVISYSALKSSQHNEPGLYSELDMQRANQHLRDNV